MAPASRGTGRQAVIARLFRALLGFFLARRVVVRGESMLPSIADGARVVVDVLAYRRRSPERFDVVLIQPPGGHGRGDVKRVCGLPGGSVVLDGDRLEVDGREVAQPPAVTGDRGRFEWQLGAGAYVVLGDNRAASTDSRDYGPVRLEQIVGKVVRSF